VATTSDVAGGAGGRYKVNGQSYTEEVTYALGDKSFHELSGELVQSRRVAEYRAQTQRRNDGRRENCPPLAAVVVETAPDRRARDSLKSMPSFDPAQSIATNQTLESLQLQPRMS
jgi:hypothetical protein